MEQRLQTDLRFARRRFTAELRDPMSEQTASEAVVHGLAPRRHTGDVAGVVQKLERCSRSRDRHSLLLLPLALHPSSKYNWGKKKTVFMVEVEWDVTAVSSLASFVGCACLASTGFGGSILFSAFMISAQLLGLSALTSLRIVTLGFIK